MPNSSLRKETNAKSKTLISSFLPRQLLINPNPNPNPNPKSINMNPTQDKSDSSQSRSILLHSISLFLEQNGFSKTLKKFRKEALIQKEDGEISWLDIEAICFEYLESRKKGTESKENFVKSEGVSDGKKSEQTIDNGSVDVQFKKKKKSKTADGASKQDIDETEAKPAEISAEAPLNFPSEHKKKSKDKKKHHKDEPEHLNKDIQEKLSEDATENVEKKEKKEKKVKKEKKEKNESKIMEVKATDSAAAATLVQNNGVGEEKKKSKKRKKPSAEENGDGDVQEAILDDSKRRRTDNLDKSNGIVQPPQTPNGSAIDSLEKDLGEKSQKKDKTQELNGSAEPRSAKAAFQRVKPDEVEFADERLQDNSYWAKDGADSGYGAKAQEVLGQVRGRDFRHEKTKKKRGSYRGGLIDLNTHSVKFNYEDEDE